MKLLNSKLGCGLPIVYILISVFLIFFQGLFGESFITVILGLPWTLFLVRFGFFGLSSLYLIALAPLVLNVVSLYIIGILIERGYLKQVLIVLILAVVIFGGIYYYFITRPIDPSEYILPESEFSNNAEQEPQLSWCRGLVSKEELEEITQKKL